MTQTLQNKLSNSKKSPLDSAYLSQHHHDVGLFLHRRHVSVGTIADRSPRTDRSPGRNRLRFGMDIRRVWLPSPEPMVISTYFSPLLFLGGVILDKFGIRFTGIMSTILMFLGAILKWYAVSHNFEGTINVPFFGEYQTQVVLAATGFAIYGVGCEIAGVTVTKILVKWFTGHELALAMGLQVALARIGTACTLAYSLPFAMGKHIEYVDTHSVGDFFANINAGIINGLTSLKDFFRAFLWCSGISGLGRRHVVYRHDCLSCLLRYGQEGRCLRSSNPSRK